MKYLRLDSKKLGVKTVKQGSNIKFLSKKLVYNEKDFLFLKKKLNKRIIITFF